jgi:hypothetical protein
LQGSCSLADSYLPAVGGWVGPWCSLWRISIKRLLVNIQAMPASDQHQENSYSPSKDSIQNLSHYFTMMEETSFYPISPQHLRATKPQVCDSWQPNERITSTNVGTSSLLPTYFLFLQVQSPIEGTAKSH